MDNTELLITSETKLVTAIKACETFDLDNDSLANMWNEINTVRNNLVDAIDFSQSKAPEDFDPLKDIKDMYTAEKELGYDFCSKNFSTLDLLRKANVLADYETELYKDWTNLFTYPEYDEVFKESKTLCKVAIVKMLGLIDLG
ncbi:MAG: hypothetical protein JXA43_01555 [Candidatus Diapherotrites archaeon]|nr:hypothetical protein [Candidatus Diapherotrites archaeon]